MKWLLPLAVWCCAVPASAQSRVYTNADLQRPLERTRTPTTEEMQGVLERQFRPEPPAEPKIVILPVDPSWPFTYSRRLEPDPWRTPAGWPDSGPGFVRYCRKCAVWRYHQFGNLDIESSCGAERRIQLDF